MHDLVGLIRYLQGAHAMETSTLEALDAFGVGYASRGANAVVENYRGTCENQLRAVNIRLDALGGKVSSTKSFVSSLMGKAADWMHVAEGEDDRNAMLLVRYYGAAQTKGAMYEALAAYARAIADVDTEALAKSHQNQEFAAAELLFPHIWDTVSAVEEDGPRPNFVL